MGEKMFKILHLLKKKKINRLFYISGSYMLPPPLTKEEESKILNELGNDENNSA